MKSTPLFRYWPAALAVLVLLAYVPATDHFLFFQGGDNAEYVSLARAIVSGHGYTSTDIYPPRPHTKYPPVFPLMIASVFAALGENLRAVKIAIALTAALTAFAAAVLWREREKGDAVALSAALITATVPFALTYMNRVLSEIPFAALCVLSLLFAEKALEKGKAGKKEVILASSFVVLACFTRSAGAALCAALAAAAMLRSPVRERIRENAALGSLMALPCLAAGLAWWGRTLWLTGGSGAYLTELLRSDPMDPGSPMIGPAAFVSRVFSNLHFYLGQLGGTLWPFMQGQALAWAGIVLCIIAALGFISVIRKRRGAPEMFFIFYSALILAWGFRETRFLIPLYPVFLYYLLKGVESLTAAVARLAPPLGNEKVKTGVLLLLASVMLVSNLKADAFIIRHVAQSRSLKGFEINQAFQVMAMDEPSADLLDAAIYLRNSSQKGSVVVSRKPRLVSLVSEMPGASIPFSVDPIETIEALKSLEATYVIFDQVHKEAREHLQPAIASYPDMFEPVHRVGNSRTVVYRFKPRDIKPQ